jgi:hypothetical protein
MRHIIDALIVGAVIAVLALPPGAPVGGFDSQHGGAAGSIQIGLRIQVDPDWILLNGTWSVAPAVKNAHDNVGRHELNIGAVPNLVGRARKGAAVVRAIRTATVCVAKQVLSSHHGDGRSEGK